jgi:WD40 repeat protein
VLAAACCSELAIIAAATAGGAVELYDEADGAPRGVWQALPSGAEGARARAVGFVRDEATGGWSVFVGGTDGSIRRRSLVGTSRSAVGADGTAPDAARDASPGISTNAAEDATAPTSLFDEAASSSELLPSHQGAVVALTPGPAGLLISGAHDGTVRVWDVAKDEPECLHVLRGYKMWLGSVCTDGKRLVSDGRDDTLMLLDFTTEQTPFEK